jgi:hemerythrin-like metal-binding protein
MTSFHALAGSPIDVPSPAPGAGPAFWRPDLFTGILAIDRQHRELLTMIDALESAALSGDLAGAEDVLNGLERHAAEHFATEEHVMWKFGYPDRDAHWSLHLAFAMELARRKSEHLANRSQTALLVDLGRWMGRWLNEHVRGADTEMARFIRCRTGALREQP